MNVYTVVNLITGIIGICVLIFGALVGFGMFDIPQNKAVVLFLLGGIIVVWALISQKRHG